MPSVLPYDKDRAQTCYLVSNKEFALHKTEKEEDFWFKLSTKILPYSREPGPSTRGARLPNRVKKIGDVPIDVFITVYNWHGREEIKYEGAHRQCKCLERRCSAWSNTRETVHAFSENHTHLLVTMSLCRFRMIPCMLLCLALMLFIVLILLCMASVTLSCAYREQNVRRYLFKSLIIAFRFLSCQHPCPSLLIQQHCRASVLAMGTSFGMHGARSILCAMRVL